jgi:hypothetical protein
MALMLLQVHTFLNAASVAGMLLTTVAAIIDEEEK